jgi:hypothetical protein
MSIDDVVQGGMMGTGVPPPGAPKELEGDMPPVTLEETRELPPLETIEPKKRKRAKMPEEEVPPMEPPEDLSIPDVYVPSKGKSRVPDITLPGQEDDEDYVPAEDTGFSFKRPDDVKRKPMREDTTFEDDYGEDEEEEEEEFEAKVEKRKEVRRGRKKDQQRGPKISLPGDL